MLKFLRTIALSVALMLPFAMQAQGIQSFDFEDGVIPEGWTNNSANPWVVTTTSQGSGHSGTYCIKSGNSGIASSTSQISATFDFADDGSISFLGGIFGEGSSTVWDKCIFEIDGEQQFAYGALGIWATYTYQIAAGTHTFTWKYSKDSSVNPTGDAFFVDDIVVDLGAVPTCIKPSNLTVSDLTAHEATFSWESEVGNYVFEYKKVSDEDWTIEEVTEETITLTDLTSVTAYTARVKAVCDADDESAYRTINFTTLVSCPAITNLHTTSVMPYSATFEWTAGLQEEAWLVYVDGDVDGVMVEEPTFELTDLEPATPHTIVVRAYCGVGDTSTSVSASCTTMVACPAPINITSVLTITNPTIATINWVQPSDATAWQICFNNNMDELIEVEGDPTYFFENLTPEVADTVKIRAVCGDEEYSEWSPNFIFTPSVKVIVGSPENTYSYLPTYILYNTSFTEQIYTTAELGEAGLIMSFDFNNTGTATQPRNITVYMKSTDKSSFANGGDWVPVSDADMVYTGTYTFVPGWNTIEFTNPFVYDGQSNVVLVVDDNTGTWTSSLPFSVFTTSTVQAIYQYSDSDNNNPANPSYSGYTTTYKNHVRIIKLPLDGCIMPTSLVATEIGPYTALLSWSENGEAESWVVAYKTITDEEFTEVEASEIPFLLEGLTPETAYTIKVRSNCDDDEIAWSSTINITTNVACPQPTELAAIDVTATSATLDWVGFSDSYNVRYRQVSAADGAQGFEGGMAGWTTIDADGDGYDWVLASEIGGVYLVEGSDITGNGHNSSTDFIASGSYSNVSGVGALTPDNYLVSPQIELGGSITFWANAQDASFAEEHFGVAVSTTSNTDPEAFTMLQEWTLNADGTGTPGPAGAKDQGEWGQFTVDLSDYEGMGYVAIRHFDCTDMFILNVDDISIEQPGSDTDNPWTELTATETSVEISDLDPITAYEWQVQAVCDGEAGSWTNLQTFTTMPTCPIPSDVTVSGITPHSVVVSWTENGESESWTLAYKTATANEFTLVEVNENPYTLEGLAAQTAYIVKVSPECEPDGWSASATFTTAISCPAPTGVNVVTVPGNATMATMTWTEAGEATVWQICLNNDLTALIDVEETATYAFENLTPEETYTAKVRAVCGEADTSQWSSSFTFQPTNKRVIGSGTATNSYLPTTSFYNYSLTQQIYTVAELGEAGVITSLDFYNGGSEKTRNLDIYMVSSDKTSFSGGSDWVPVTEADLVYSGNVTFTANVWTSIEFASPFIYDGVNNVILVVDDNSGSWSSGLSCRVFDANAQAIRIYSDGTNYDPTAPSSYSGTVEAAKNQLRLAVSPLGACVMPTLFTATEVGPTSAVLSWQENSEATAWTVAYRTEAEETFTEVVANDNPFTLENLANETTYILKVRSNCADDEISWSNEITITTLPSCPAPTDIEVDPLAHSAEVSWTGFSDSYILEYAEFAASSTLQYDDGTVATNIGNSTPDNWTWATMYPTEMLEDATTLLAVSFYVEDGYITSDVTINIYGGGTDAPETLQHTQNVSVAAGSGFQTFILSEPVTIDPTQNLWIALNCEGTYVMASCSANDPNNQWVYYEGEWSAIGDLAPSLDTYGWMIRGLAGDPLEWTAINPATSPQEITNLTPETVYAVRVKGNCGEESSAWSDIVTFTTTISCPAPTGLAAVLTPGNGTIATLNWTEAGEASNWQICLDNNMANLIAVTGTPTYNFTGLIPEQAYTAKVRAICGEGDTSSWSNAYTFLPTNAYEITVAEGENTNGYVPVYGYYADAYLRSQIIYPATMLADIEGASITSLTFYAQESNVQWGDANFSVNITEVEEATFASAAWNTTASTLVYSGALEISNNKMVVNLTQPYTYAGGNLLVEVINNVEGTYVESTFLGLTATGASIQGYSYSSLSDITPSMRNFLPKTTFGFIPGGAVCHAPTITGTEVTETSVTVNFTGDADNYEVVIMEGAWGEPTSGMIPVTTTSYTFSGLTPATQYTVGVRALCEEELTSDWVYQMVTTLELVCPAPTNVVVSDVTMTGATVAWTAADEAQTSWQVNVTGLNYDQTFTATTNPYTLTGLTAGVEYTVKVRAICGDGYSEWSDAATFTTGVCEAVSNVIVSNITTNSATIAWTAAEGQTSWQLDYGPQGHPQGTGTTVVVNTNPYTLTGLEEYTPYDIYVRAICDDGVFSDWSVKANFTTLQTEGIEGVNSDLVKLYPNPASTTVTISGISGEATVSVVDMNGRTVYSERAHETLTIDLSGYAQGAYFVRISGEQTMAIRKLIVK